MSKSEEQVELFFKEQAELFLHVLVGEGVCKDVKSLEDLFSHSVVLIFKGLVCVFKWLLNVFVVPWFLELLLFFSNGLPLL